MFAPLLLLAAAPLLSDVAVWRDAGTLEVRVRADGALDPAAAGAVVGDRSVVLTVPAALEGAEATFGTAPVRIRARPEGEAVRVEIPVGGKLACAGPATIAAHGEDLRVSVPCPERGAAPTATAGAAAARPADDPLTPPGPEALAAPAPEVKTADTVGVPPPAEVANTSGVTPPANVLDTAGVTPAVPAADTATGSPPALPADAAEDPAFGGAPELGLRQVLLPALALAGLGGIALLLTRRRARAARLVEIVETASLGPKRSLIVARVGGETLILGASEAGIALLGSRTGLPAPEDGRPDGPTGGRNAEEAFFASGPGEEAERLLRTLHREGPPAGPDAPPARGAGILGRILLKKVRPSAAGFETALRESLEDQELRAKLHAGFKGTVA